MEYFTLNNGVKMPALGFGVYKVPDPAEAERAVTDALECGYRLIDTAASYLNEEAVGRAIKGSGIPRDEIFVTTKLWIQDQGYDNCLKAFDTSLKKLGLDTLDLYIIHKPYGDYYGSWRAMERLYREGRVRAIGVSSFWIERLADLFTNNEIMPAVNQVETNLWHQQKALNGFMNQYGIQHEAWAPFAEGNNDIFNTRVLKEIGLKYGKSTGQVMLRWLLQRGIAAIPKTVHKERMKENIDIFDFTLTDEDMERLSELDTGRSTIYDEMDPTAALHFGTKKIHD